MYYLFSSQEDVKSQVNPKSSAQENTIISKLKRSLTFSLSTFLIKFERKNQCNNIEIQWDKRNNFEVQLKLAKIQENEVKVIEIPTSYLSLVLKRRISLVPGFQRHDSTQIHWVHVSIGPGQYLVDYESVCPFRWMEWIPKHIFVSIGT